MAMADESEQKMLSAFKNAGLPESKAIETIKNTELAENLFLVLSKVRYILSNHANCVTTFC